MNTTFATAEKKPHRFQMKFLVNSLIFIRFFTSITVKILTQKLLMFYEVEIVRNFLSIVQNCKKFGKTMEVLSLFWTVTSFRDNFFLKIYKFSSYMSTNSTRCHITWKLKNIWSVALDFLKNFELVKVYIYQFSWFDYSFRGKNFFRKMYKLAPYVSI